MLEELPATIEKHDQIRIELETREQRNCRKWYEYRRRRITASNFGKVFKFKKESTKIKFARSLFDVDNDQKYVPLAAQYGIDHENDAVEKYLTLDRCQNVVYFKRGLWVPTWENCAWLGASVDGEIVVKSATGARESGIVEIKTIFDLEAKSIAEVAQKRKGSFYMTTLPAGKFALKNNSNHYFQIQGQMAVCEVSFCDFVVYHPTSGEIFVQRIEFDDAFWSNTLFPKLKQFYYKYVYPLHDNT